MKLKIILLACMMFGFSKTYFSQQKTHTLVFSPMFGPSFLSDSVYYKTGSKDSVQITALKFYISNIEVYEQQKLVWKETNSYHLADLSKAGSMNITLNLPAEIKFSEIRFNLGIDSLSNVSGAMGGALDPTSGMYWTWQSGYINLKLEGKSNLCKTRNNEFQFHLGGYQPPFSGMQNIKLKASATAKTNVVMDLEKILDAISLGEQNHIMSPCIESVVLSQIIAKTIESR